MVARVRHDASRTLTSADALHTHTAISVSAMTRPAKTYFRPRFRVNASRIEDVEPQSELMVANQRNLTSGESTEATVDGLGRHNSKHEENQYYNVNTILDERAVSSPQQNASADEDSERNTESIRIDAEKLGFNSDKDKRTHKHIHRDRHNDSKNHIHSDSISPVDDTASKRSGLIFINSNYNHAQASEMNQQQHPANALSTSMASCSSSGSVGTLTSNPNSISNLFKKSMKRSDSPSSTKHPIEQPNSEKDSEIHSNNFISYSPPVAKQSSFRKLYNKTKHKRNSSSQSQDDKNKHFNVSTNFITYTPPKETGSPKEPIMKTRPTLHLHIRSKSRFKKSMDVTDANQSPVTSSQPTETILNFSKASSTSVSQGDKSGHVSTHATPGTNSSSANNTPQSAGTPSYFPTMSTSTHSFASRNRSTSASSSYLRQQNQFTDDYHSRVSSVLDTTVESSFGNPFEYMEESITPIHTPNTIDEENFEVCSVTTSSTKRFKTLRRSNSNISDKSYSSANTQAFTPQNFSESPLLANSSGYPFASSTQVRPLSTPHTSSRARIPSISSNISFQSVPQYQQPQQAITPQLQHNNQQYHTVHKSPSLSSLMGNANSGISNSRQASTSNSASHPAVYSVQSSQHVLPLQQIKSRSRSSSAFQQHHSIPYYQTTYQSPQLHTQRSSTPIEVQSATFPVKQQGTPGKIISTPSGYSNLKVIGLDSYLSYIDEMKKANGGVPFRGNASAAASLPAAVSTPSTSMTPSSMPISNSSLIYTSQDSSMLSSATFPSTTNVDFVMNLSAFDKMNGQRDISRPYSNSSSSYVNTPTNSSKLNVNIAAESLIGHRQNHSSVNSTDDQERGNTDNSNGANTSANNNVDGVQAFVFAKQQQILRQQLHCNDPQVLSNVEDEDNEMEINLENLDQLQNSQDLQELQELGNLQDFPLHSIKEAQSTQDMKDLEDLHLLQDLDLQNYANSSSLVGDKYDVDVERNMGYNVGRNTQMNSRNVSGRGDMDDILMDDLDQLINITRLEAIAKELEEGK